MKILCYREKANGVAPLGEIFLAGPTIRGGTWEPHNGLWRDEALKQLEEFGFGGLVVVPEFRGLRRDAELPGDRGVDTEELWEWERFWLDRVNVIMFWVPRDMVALPGLTTNIEFGMYLGADSEVNKIVFGAPTNASHVDYMRWCCKREEVPQATTMPATVHHALVLLAEKLAERTDGT